MPPFMPAVDQIWKDKDKRRERFLKIISLTDLDAYVRSCDLRGEFCPSTPRTYISISRLTSRYALVSTPATIVSVHDNS